MGANAVNTAVERLAPLIEKLTGGRAHLRILSNLADRRLTKATCVIKKDQLAFGEFSAEQVRHGILEAWAFAAADPYRAATHNKGIMNGVDAVVIATGNDWRAVEAGAHAYAAHFGRYYQPFDLVGDRNRRPGRQPGNAHGGRYRGWCHAGPSTGTRLLEIDGGDNCVRNWPRSLSRSGWRRTWQPSGHLPPRASSAGI